MTRKPDIYKAEQQFIAALRTRNLELSDALHADGELHRCNAANKEGNRGRNDGVYVLHLNGWPAGAMRNYTDSKGWTKWKYTSEERFSATERAKLYAETWKAQAKASLKRDKKARAVARTARRTWKGADDVEEHPYAEKHPYLEAKGIKPYGLRRFVNSLVVPVRGPDRKIINLQYIDGDGAKRFIEGGRVGGGYFRIRRTERDPGRTILICEGFATAASLHEATGGEVYVAFNAGNLAAVARLVRERHPQAQIIVCADDDAHLADNPGVSDAKKAARAVKGLVAIPKFGENREDDDTDFNDLHRKQGLREVRVQIAASSDQPKQVDPEPEDEDEDEDEGENKGKGKALQTELIIEQADEAGLFHTDDDKCYADIERNGHRETLRIGSTAFRHWLMHEYYRKSEGEVPSAQPLQAAIETLKARARYDGPRRTVHLRVGSAKGKIYLDLGDKTWGAVEVDDRGWRVIDNPPVRFRRAPAMLALPTPVKGEVTKALRTLRSLVNVRKDGREASIDDADFVLLVIFMAAALRSDQPSLPYPILGIQGEEGSAKSTLARIVEACIDPHKIKERRLPREDRDLFIGANNRHVVAFGNVSQLPEWLSNSLCNLSTGGGFATRQLHTDEDEILFSATRVIILNGIKFAVRPDLADRMVLLMLPSIAPGFRRSDKRLWKKFERAQPQILGALLKIVSHGLRELPATPEEDTLRMSDFVQWGMACEQAVWEPGTFRQAYAANRRKATLEVIEADVVADAIRSLVTAKEPNWKGTMQGLLDVLSVQVGERQSKSKEWPSGARELRSRLDHARATLRRVGITIRLGAKARRGRMISLRFEELAVPSKLGKDSHHRHHAHLSLKSNNLDDAGPGDEGGDRRNFEPSGRDGHEPRGAGLKTRRNADRHQDRHHVSDWKTTTSDDGDDGAGLSPTYSEKDIEVVGPVREEKPGYRWDMTPEEKERRIAHMRRYSRQRKKRDNS